MVEDRIDNILADRKDQEIAAFLAYCPICQNENKQRASDDRWKVRLLEVTKKHELDRMCERVKYRSQAKDRAAMREARTAEPN